MQPDCGSMHSRGGNGVSRPGRDARWRRCNHAMFAGPAGQLEIHLAGVLPPQAHLSMEKQRRILEVCSAVSADSNEIHTVPPVC